MKKNQLSLAVLAALMSNVIIAQSNPTTSAECTGAHISCFTSILPTAQTSKLILPTEISYQLLLKEGQAYTDGKGTVGGLNDFTAYVAKNKSSVEGYLSINHETNPGGVTMAEVKFNTDKKLWEVTKSRAVNFNEGNLVQTARNCSGGITPWGTIVTAEEAVTATDSNLDGYKDYGWFVEVDPATAKVVSKNADGTAAKLWQMGIMNHENVVINNDGTVAYFGEDGGTHLVYKYVMDKPNDLSSGTLYVLRAPQGLSSGNPVSPNAVWVKVPNKILSDQNNTASIAKSLGGTSFNGVEDIEISPLDGKIYFTAKGLSKVYRFRDNGDTISELETFVGGSSTVYSFTTSAGVKSESWGSGNDNLTFDDKGNLWVLQDGGKNYIWVVAPDHTPSNPKVRLFASMPAGAEPTGLTFTPDYKYGFFSIQHPSSTIATDVDASGNTVDYRGKSATVVIALDQFLGKGDVLSTVDQKISGEIVAAPNPTDGIVKITAPETLKNPSITAYSTDGRIVFQKQFAGSLNGVSLNLSHPLAASQHLILNIAGEGYEKTLKVVKK